MWWDAERIEADVTRQFVCSHLLPEEIERLDRPLAFGDGLTDGTYWEWIDEKAKRIFLTLVDIGVPDQIFGVIDDSWDDDDLPIAKDQVERLALTPSKDEKSERKFFYRQYHYLLKPLQKGEHILYLEPEVVPLDTVEKRPGLTQNHAVDKVELPNVPGQVFCRRRIPLGSGHGCLTQEDFIYEVNSIKNVQNEHLVSYWASYEHQGYGYVLFTPASDFTLKSFLANTPSCVKNLDKQTRRQLIVNWIHCLVDTLCFIHNRGLSHGNIKPSTIMFNNTNHIFFSDFTQLNPDILASSGSSSFDKESYDYAAPEQWFRPSGSSGSIQRKATLTSMSTSPDNTTFSISKGGPEGNPHSPQAMMHTPNPQLNPQAADIFSLGCVILELLSYLMKRQTKSFATHRSAKHKSPGRGGAVLDSSFHRNLGQVESWMTGLARDAAKKDGQVFRGMAPLLHVVERMLALHPGERPSAYDVQTRMYQVITEAAGITEPHCVHQYGGWDFGIGSLKLGSKIPAVDSNAETMSILTKRSSGRSQLEHRRTNSGGSAGWMSGIQTPRGLPPSGERYVGSGFEAIRGLPVRQAPSYTEADGTTNINRNEREVD